MYKNSPHLAQCWRCGQKTYESIVVGVPQQHRAVTGSRTVEIDDQRVDAVLRRAQVSNVVANDELQRGRVDVTRRMIIVCPALRTTPV